MTSSLFPIGILRYRTSHRHVCWPRRDLVFRSFGVLSPFLSRSFRSSVCSLALSSPKTIPYSAQALLPRCDRVGAHPAKEMLPAPRRTKPARVVLSLVSLRRSFPVRLLRTITHHSTTSHYVPQRLALGRTFPRHDNPTPAKVTLAFFARLAWPCAVHQSSAGELPSPKVSFRPCSRIEPFRLYSSAA